LNEFLSVVAKHAEKRGHGLIYVIDGFVGRRGLGEEQGAAAKERFAVLLMRRHQP